MAGNPFDQFDPSASSAAPASGANPFDQFDSKGKAAAPSDNDYSNSPLSAVARTFESSADWGTGDLLRAAVTGKKPSETAAQSSAAAASLPWYIRYPTEAAGYGAGLVNLLDPVTDAAELGALGLGASAKLAKVAGTAAEGATVGGVSHVAGSDDPGIMDTAGAALGGAAVGGAAGVAAPLINKGLTKALGKSGTVDPAAAIAQTEAAKKTAYDALHAPTAPTFYSGAISNAYVNSINALTDVQRGDVSTDFMKKMQQHVNQAQQAGAVSAGTVDEYTRSLQSIASPSNSAEQVLAAKVRDALTGDQGVLATARPVNGLPVGQAFSMLSDARAANTQWEAAKKLAEWTATTKAGGSLGQKPLTEAEDWYQGKPQYQDLVDIYKANQGMMDPSSMVAHTGGAIGGAVGGAIAGWPGMIVGHPAGMAATKYLTKGLVKKYKTGNMLKQLTAAYPSLTGVQPTGATIGSQLPQGAGDMIKNLMLGVGAS